MKISRLIALLTCSTVFAAAATEEAPLVEGLRDLKRLNRELVEMAPKAQAATVALVSKKGNGSGSGVIVGEDGLVLTAAHVMAALSDEVIVILPDGKRLNAEKLGADFDRDAAMVRIIDEGPFPWVRAGDGAPLRRNDWCVALGHPGGFDPARTPPLRLGRVLSEETFLVTDCAVVGGDSGGPLFDADGVVVGIHSNIGATLSENRHVPMSVFRDQWEELLDGRRSGSRFGGEMKRTDPDRPMMGVRLADGSDKGVGVIGVMPGSPAEKAGMRKGDVITAVSDEEVTRREQLVGVVNRFLPGNRIEVVATRGGKEKTFQVKLARLGDLQSGQDDEPGTEGDAEAGDDALERYLDEMLEGTEGESGELRLELSPEQIEEFGGMDQLMERLKEKVAERKGEADRNEAGDESEASAPTPDRAEPAPEEREARIEELLERALKLGGRLELTPDEAAELGGVAELTRRLREKVESMNADELMEFAREAGMVTEDPFFESSMKALQPVVRKASGSTAVVTVDGEPVALGTFVSEDGWLLTKDTETAAGRIQVVWEGEARDARRIERFPRHDLALYEVEGEGFEPVRWAPANRLKLGALLAVPGGEGTAVGIGLVSVLPRPLADIGFLGVAMESDDDGGVRVREVVSDSGAAEAGVEEGDRVLALNGETVSDPMEFGARIRGFRTGETVRLEVEREGVRMSLDAELGERPEGRQGGRFRRMNEMSGRMSERTGGFPTALQHDIPLGPESCGGPLLDLQGRCVGINVSRAGRVKTYAIPADAVKALLAGVDEEEITKEEMEAVRELIREVQGHLTELQERLERLETR